MSKQPRSGPQQNGAGIATSADGAAKQRQEIEALKVLAEAGMGENAPHENALAREKLLQLYRARQAASGHLDIESATLTPADPWSTRDFQALEWLCRLDATGHAGAAGLLDRVLNQDILTRGTADAERARQLGEKFPRVARFLARQECSKQNPEFRVLTEWLDRGGAEAASIVTGIRELYIDSLPGSWELHVLRRFVGGARGSARDRGEGDLLARRGDLFAEIAQTRLHSKATDGEATDGEGFDIVLPGDAAEAESQRVETRYSEAATMDLLARAVEMGSRKAGELLWRTRYEAAPDKQEYLRDWLATSPNPKAQIPAVCMLVGAAVEQGVAGASPDLRAALRWYASALGLARLADGTSGALDSAACLAIAVALENRESRYRSFYLRLEDVWYDRAWEKPELARACLEMGDIEGARELLNRILDTGKGSELDLARKLLDEIPVK